MKCPTCGYDPDAEMPWQTSRRLGYDQHKHCTMLANKAGKVVTCWGRRAMGYPVCDDRCPIHRRFTADRPVGVGGRMVRVWVG